MSSAMFEPGQMLARPRGFEPEEAEPGLLRTLADDSTTANLIRTGQAFVQPTDRSFVLTTEMLNEATEGLTMMQRGYVATNARSEQHFKTLVEQQKQQNQRDEKLAEYGWLGFTGKIGSLFIDPSELTVGVGVALASSVTLGSSGAAEIVRKTDRVRRIVRDSAVAGATFSTLTALEAATDTRINEFDILAAGVVAGGIGGLATKLGDDGLVRAATQYHRKVADISVQKELDRLSEMGFNVKSRLVGSVENGEPAEIRTALQRLADTGDMDPETSGFFRAVSELPDNEMSEFAEKLSSKPVYLNQTPESTEMGASARWSLDGMGERDIGKNSKIVSKARVFGLSGWMTGSKNPTVRWLGDHMVENVLAFAEGRPNVYSASQYANTTRQQITFTAQRQLRRVYENYAKRTGARWWSSEAEDTFQQEVGNAIRLMGRSEFDELPEDIQQAARIYSKQTEDAFGEAKLHRVPGTENLEHRNGYFARLWSDDAIQRARRSYGHEAVVRVIAKGFARNNPLDTPEATDKLARKVADRIIKTIGDKKYATHSRQTMGLTSGQREIAEDIMRGEWGLSEAEIESLFTSIDRRRGKGDYPDRMKYRIDLDDQVDIDTDKGPLKLIDLLENRADRVVNRYTQEMVGEAAMADIYRELSRVAQRELGLAAPPKINGLAEAEDVIRQVGAKIGDSKSAVDGDVRRVMIAMKSVLGMKLGDMPDRIASGLRIGRNANVARLMGMSAFAQTADLGYALSEAGLSATFLQMDSFVKFRRNILDGKMTNEVAAEIEAFVNPAAYHRNAGLMSRFDPAENIADQGFGAVESGSRTLANATLKGSGMAKMTDMQRLGFTRAFIQRFYDNARNNKSWNTKRLLSMGLDEDMARRINKGLLSEATEKLDHPLGRGRKIGLVRFDRWDDQEAAGAFARVLDQVSKRVVQENDIGQAIAWGTTDWGRSLLQLRSFVIGSYEKHLLFNIAQRDLDAATYFLSTMAVASGTYMIRTYAQSIGRDDQQKFLEERLSNDKIAAGAFYMSGFSSILPQAVDTVNVRLLGNEGMFGYSRSTGLPTETLMGNPTSDLLDSSVRVGQSAVRGFGQLAGTGAEFGQDDARAIARVTPLANVHLIGMGLNYMISGLPKRGQDAGQ